MPVVEAVTRDLALIGGELAESAMAETALALARELDSPGNSATSKSMCAKALLDVMNRLRELAPPRKESDGVDDLASRRAERQSAAGLAAAAHQPRP